MEFEARQLKQMIAANGVSDSTPDWAELLKDVLASLPVRNKPSADAGAPGAPQPFDALWLPFARWASDRLLEAVDLQAVSISPNALADLESHLLSQLARTSQHALFEHFTDFCAPHQSTSKLLLGPEPPAEPESQAAPRKRYEAFIEQMHQGGLVDFYLAYPVLARLTAQLVAQWLENTQELLDRLRTDHETLAGAFGNGITLGEVVAIETARSDRHSAGRCVSILAFASGAHVVYKPRDVGIEAAFGDFLHWFNDRSAIADLQTLTVVARRGYGWVEFVDGAACNNLAEVQLFYQRIGALLCILYALCGRDIHVDNLIANGSQPVIVDLEGLLHPEFMDAASPTAALVATQLLPIWQRDRHGMLHNVGGVDVPSAHRKTMQREVWVQMNTDSMRLEGQFAAVPVFANAPTLNGAPLAAADYSAETLDGFSQTFSLLRLERQKILAPGAVVDQLSRQQTRFFPRPTQQYAERIRASLQAGSLRGGEGVASVLTDLEDLRAMRGDPQPLQEAEHQALRRLDIPRFEITTKGRDLQLDHGALLVGYFDSSSKERVAARLQSLEANNLEDMQSFIRTMFSLSKLSQLL